MTPEELHDLEARWPDTRLVNSDARKDVGALVHALREAWKERDSLRSELCQVMQEHVADMQSATAVINEAVQIEAISRQALKDQVVRMQAELRKQVHASRVVFDRQIVEWSQLASDDPLEWPRYVTTAPAYKRGAEALRERAARVVDEAERDNRPCVRVAELADKIRALPIDDQE